jgi:hypothetical protein
MKEFLEATLHAVETALANVRNEPERAAYHIAQARGVIAAKQREIEASTAGNRKSLLAFIGKADGVLQVKQEYPSEQLAEGTLHGLRGEAGWL